MKPLAGTKPDRFPWRFGFYLIVFFYLAGDLYFFNGPIRRAIDARQIDGLQNAPDQSEWVAIVNREPITKRQIEVAVMQHLFRRGRSIDQLSEKNERILRVAVLQEMIDNTLIRQYSNGAKSDAPQSQVDAFVASFEAQFENAADLEARSAGQKMDANARHAALADIQNQKRWIENRIARAVNITDEAAQDWYEENHEKGEGFTNPERLHARHIFISTVIDSSPAREVLIRDIHTKLTLPKADFGKLALEFSEDRRTKKFGGDLNWFTAARMPEDFYTAITKLKVGEISQPFKTKIGWHIAELIERKPTEKLSFEVLKPEIIARLKSERKSVVVRELLLKLRRVAAIKISPERL